MLHPLYRVPLPDETPKPYGFWGRTSSDRQKKFHTIEGQLEEWFDYCKRNDIDPYTDVHYFLDEGVRGGIPIWERPNGAVMQRYIQNGYVTAYIVTMYIDRTARDDVGSIYDIMDECEEYGLHFRAINDGVDTRNEDADTHAGINAVFARANKRKQLKRMAAGKARKAKQGYWIGSQPPYGHTLTPDNRLVVHPDHAQIVRLFHRLVTTEGYGKRSLATYANANGIPTPSGKGVWAHGSIDRVLGNKSLYGEAEWNKERTIRKHNRPRRRFRNSQEEIIPVPCPAILTKAEWEEMHRALAVNSRTYRNTGEFAENVLLSNLYCGECGARYYPAGSKYKEIRYYTYRHAWKDGQDKACNQKSLLKVSDTKNVPPEKGIDGQLWQKFVEVAQNLTRWRTTLESFVDTQAVTDYDLALQAHEQAQATLEDLDRSFWRKRQLTRQQYDSLLPALQADVERTEQALLSARARANAEQHRTERIDTLQAQLEKFQGTLEHATHAEKREILASVLDKVLYQNGVFSFNWLV